MPEEVSQAEFKKMKADCEDYRKAMERIKDYEQEVSWIEEKLAAATTPFEKELFSQDLVKAQRKLEADTEMTSFIRWGLSQLEPKTSSVLQQLYIDGIVWQDIQDEDGRILNSSSIWFEKEKGLRQLAIILRKKKSAILSGKSDGE